MKEWFACRYRDPEKGHGNIMWLCISKSACRARYDRRVVRGNTYAAVVQPEDAGEALQSMQTMQSIRVKQFCEVKRDAQRRRFRTQT